MIYLKPTLNPQLEYMFFDTQHVTLGKIMAIFEGFKVLQFHFGLIKMTYPILLHIQHVTLGKKNQIVYICPNDINVAQIKFSSLSNILFDTQPVTVSQKNGFRFWGSRGWFFNWLNRLIWCHHSVPKLRYIHSNSNHVTAGKNLAKLTIFLGFMILGFGSGFSFCLNPQCPGLDSSNNTSN